MPTVDVVSGESRLDSVRSMGRQVLGSVWLAVIAFGVLCVAVGAWLQTGELAGILATLGVIYVLLGTVSYGILRFIRRGSPL